MRKISILTIILCLIFISGCRLKTKKSFKDLEEIKYEEILSKDGQYLVLIINNTCDACESLEEVILDYNKAPKYPIYCLNSSNESNKEIVSLTDDSTYDYFVDATDYKKVKITKTPALIIIENHKVKDFISSKVTNTPKTDISNYIENLTN